MNWFLENAETVGLVVSLIWNAFLQSTKAKKYMGFLSGIGKAIGKVAGIAGDLGGIASGIGAVSGLLGGGADDERDFAVASAQQANQFTREQLQNRHQWEVNDLRAAGLNPILSAMKGAPSIGGSAQAVANASSGSEFADYSNAASNATNSATAARQLKLNTEKLESEIDLLKSNAQASKAQAIQSQTAGVKNLADTNLSKAELEKILATLPAIKSSAENEKKEKDSIINRYIRPHTKPFADMIGDYTGAIGNVFHGSQSSTTHYKGQ